MKKVGAGIGKFFSLSSGCCLFEELGRMVLGSILVVMIDDVSSSTIEERTRKNVRACSGRRCR